MQTIKLRQTTESNKGPCMSKSDAKGVPCASKCDAKGSWPRVGSENVLVSDASVWFGEMVHPVP